MFKRFVVLFAVVAVIAGEFSTAYALGTPQITVIDPPSGQPVGTCVKVRARVDWDSDFRSMRMKFGNEGWQEEATPEFERTFCTGSYGPGTYTIRIEVDRQGGNWSGATSTEAQYVLTAPPQPTQPPTPYGPPISVVSFNPSGGVEVGQSVTIHIKVDSSNPGAIRVTPPCGGVSHIETTTPEFDDIWNTAGCGAGNQTVHVCARDVNDPNWAYATCTDRSYSLFAPPPPPVPAPTANFWADSASIQTGQCTTLHWTTSDASAVDIDGSYVSASGDMQVCPAITKHYSLKAVGPGGEATRSLTVQVYASPAPTTVANPVSSFHTGDVIKIGNDVFVIVDGARRLVPNPDTLDALGISQSWVNNKGYSDTQLSLISRGSDIPDVNKDHQGFATFKATFFPNTSPIVPATAPPRGSFSLTVAPTSVAAGGSVGVSWSGYNPDGNDWISMHQAGRPDSEYLTWQYARGSSGSLTFTAPQQPGWYEFRLFRNGPKFATSNTFQVLLSEQALPQPDQLNPGQPSGQKPPDQVTSGWIPGRIVSPDSGPGLIPRALADEPGSNPFPRGQCTYYVYGHRSDVPSWAYDAGNAETWASLAESRGLQVDHGDLSKARPGDIVVWQGGQGGASSAGHVAILVGKESNNTLVVNESNHCRTDSSGNVICDLLTYEGNKYTFSSAYVPYLSFIHEPSGSTVTQTTSGTVKSGLQNFVTSFRDWLNSQWWWPFGK